MKILVGFMLLVSQAAFATGGLDCEGIRGSTLKIYTDEAAVEGNNVISMKAVIGNGAKVVEFNGSEEISVSRDEGTIYAAANAKKEAITLEMNAAKFPVEGQPLKEIDVALAIIREVRESKNSAGEIKTEGVITREFVACKSAAN